MLCLVNEICHQEGYIKQPWHWHGIIMPASNPNRPYNSVTRGTPVQQKPGYQHSSKMCQPLHTKRGNISPIVPETSWTENILWPAHNRSPQSSDLDSMLECSTRMQAYGLLQLSCKRALNHDHTLYRLHLDKSSTGTASTWGKTHPKPKWVIRYIHLKSLKDQLLILHQEWISTPHQMTQAKMPHMKCMTQIYTLTLQHT